MLDFVARENELLKHQLRKYVSAVQMLRQQGASDTGASVTVRQVLPRMDK